jgi:tetratricopeptide (TPR) repeat protein
LECFLLLSPEKDAAENSLALAERIEQWNGFENLSRDYQAYVASRKTFAELMEEGRTAYAAGDTQTAYLLFSDAIAQRPNQYAPHYYLGLIYYADGSYYWAEQSYNRSLELGADEALVYYALGLNAASFGLVDQAAEFLNRAAVTDPARYREKAATLLRRLGKTLE